jgi:hypothetical protein
MIMTNEGRPQAGRLDDAVPWLQRFREEHPEIEVTPPSPRDPFWGAYRAGEKLASGYFLSQLRDSLTPLLAQEKTRS